MTVYRRIVIYVMELVYIAVMILADRLELLLPDLLPDGLFRFSSIEVPGVLVMIGVITLSPILIDLFGGILDKIYVWWDARHAAKKKRKKSIFGG